MPVDLRWYEEDGETPAGPLAFAQTNGAPSDPVELILQNDGTDDAPGVSLSVLARPQGSSVPYSATDDLAANRWVEARLIDSSAGAPPQVTGWLPVGGGWSVSLRAIPAGESRTLEVRTNVPAGVGTQAKDVLLRPLTTPTATPITPGLPAGVRSGLGRVDMTYLASGGEVTPSGTPDSYVHVAPRTWVFGGQSLAADTEDVELTQAAEDGALTAGKYYWACLSVGGSDSVTVTKSDALTAPPDLGALPAPPAGEIVLADVVVPYDDDITAAEIVTTRRELGAFALTLPASGLSVVVSGGEAVVSDRLIRKTAATDLTLDDDGTSWILLDADGIVQAVTDEPTGAGAILLWVVTAASGSITRAQDARVLVGERPAATLTLTVPGALSVSSVSAPVLLPSRAQTLPARPLRWALGNTGGASGKTSIDLELSDAGGAWTSLGILAGDAIAYDGAPAAEGFVETTTLPPGSRVRLVVSAVPGTASADLVAELQTELL